MTTKIKQYEDQINTFLNDKNEDSCIELLEKFDSSYYNGKGLIPDYMYDYFREEVELLFPDNDYFLNVGAKVNINYGKKITHKYPMKSMGKTKTIEEIIKWLNKISDKRIELITTPKIDGLSASIVYENGELKYCATRGNGIEGQDISFIKDYINIPKTISIKEYCEVRGELYLPVETDFPNPENKPLRNLCSGLINRKDKLDDTKYVNFIAFQCMCPSQNFKKESEKFSFIKDLGFDKVTPHSTFNSVKEFEDFYNLYLKDRSTLKYETDGMVVTVNDLSLHESINKKGVVDRNNLYDICIKPPSQTKMTSFLGIEWEVSRLGNVIPVGKVKSIVIGGSTINNVTLNNYENVINLKLQKGDDVEIAKANEIIPYFVANHTMNGCTSNDLILEECSSCGSTLYQEGVHLKCKNSKKCPEQQIQKIVKWVESIDGISEATIRVFFEKGLITNIRDLYNLKKDAIKTLDGFEERSAQFVVDVLDKNKKMNVHQFVAKLSIPLVGEKACKKLEINVLDNFLKFNDSRYVIGQNIIEWNNDSYNTNLIKELLEVIEVTDYVKVQTKGRVCMTGDGGKKRPELINDLFAMGYEFVSGVSKNTDILICEDKSGNTNKLKKARELGIKIVTYDEFFKE